MQSGAACEQRSRNGQPSGSESIDGVMPGLGTADVLARSAELAPSMGVLVCSGYLREDLLRRGVEAGRYAFLAKPFTAEQLLTGVDSVIRAAAASRTAS